jgi:hypothetical protein
MAVERLVYLAKDETIPDSGTFIKNIDIVDAITQLDIIIKATTGATSCVDHELHDDITKIEVVDGGDVLHSLSMIEEQALNCYEKGRFPLFNFDEGASKTVYEGCHIMFGRHTRDREFCLDPKKFKNPQLRITHSLTISGTAGFVSGTGTITVIAHVLEGQDVVPRGFLLSKEHYNYSTQASAHEYIDMPTDYPYRMLMIKALLSTYGWEELIANIKLHADRGKFVKVDISGTHLFYQGFDIWDPFVQLKTLLTADQGTALMDLYYALDVTAHANTAKTIGLAENVDSDKVTLGVLKGTSGTTKVTAAGTKAVRVTYEGYQPHSCVAIPMGALQEPNEWWDVRNHSSVELDVLATSTGTASAAVVLQQLREY